MRRTFVGLVICLGLGCAPAHDPPPDATVTPDTSGGDAPRPAGDEPDGDESLLPDPPSSTLRAPADDRREEVAPGTGLPPPQSQ